MAVGDDVAVGTGDVLGGVGGGGGGGEAVGVGVGVETGGGRGTTDDSGDAVGETVGGGSNGGGSLSAAMAIVATTAITAVTIVVLIIVRRRRRWARSAATEDLLDPALAERDPAPDLADDPSEDEHRNDDREVAPRVGDRRLYLLPRTPRHRNGGSP